LCLVLLLSWRCPQVAGRYRNSRPANQVSGPSPATAPEFAVEFHERKIAKSLIEEISNGKSARVPKRA